MHTVCMQMLRKTPRLIGIGSAVGIDYGLSIDYNRAWPKTAATEGNHMNAFFGGGTNASLKTKLFNFCIRCACCNPSPFILRYHVRIQQKTANLIATNMYWEARLIKFSEDSARFPSHSKVISAVNCCIARSVYIYLINITKNQQSIYMRWYVNTQRIYFLFDNGSDMRSRVVLTMAGLLVRSGWFEEVVLSYSMPGHGRCTS